MSFSVGFPNAAAVTIGGKSAATLNALSQASAEAADETLGQTQAPGQVRTSMSPASEGKAEKSGSTQSIAVQVLLKRMHELQQHVRKKQQQLDAEIGKAPCREKRGK